MTGNFDIYQFIAFTRLLGISLDISLADFAQCLNVCVWLCSMCVFVAIHLCFYSIFTCLYHLYARVISVYNYVYFFVFSRCILPLHVPVSSPCLFFCLTVYMGSFKYLVLFFLPHSLSLSLSYIYIYIYI